MTEIKQNKIRYGLPLLIPIAALLEEAISIALNLYCQPNDDVDSCHPSLLNPHAQRAMIGITAAITTAVLAKPLAKCIRASCTFFYNAFCNRKTDAVIKNPVVDENATEISLQRHYERL